MNKLTTIKTIKKAAPLALLAVVMSGSAFAGPGKGNGPKDKGPKGEPKASVSVVTSCSLCGYPSASGYDPREYIDCIYDDPSNPTLYVSAKITDETGDVYDPIMLELDVDANLTRKDAGGGPNAWTNVAEKSIDAPSNGTWDTTFDLCVEDPTIGGAKAASAIVNVVVTEGDASKAVYSSRCENFDPYPDTEEDEDGIDQSDFDIRSLGISCVTER